MPTEGYLLTKTHCTGYCMECPPDMYMISLEHFMNSCRAGVRPKTLKELENKADPRPNRGVAYDYELVKKAILLIRNPYDNIVANFRYAYGIHKKRGDNEFKLPKDSKGFTQWCESLDEQFAIEEEKWFSPLIKAAA